VGPKPHPVDGSVLEVLGREVAIDDCEEFDLGCLGQEARQVWIVVQLAALSERIGVLHCKMKEVPCDRSGLDVVGVQNLVNQPAGLALKRVVVGLSAEIPARSGIAGHGAGC